MNITQTTSYHTLRSAAYTAYRYLPPRTVFAPRLPSALQAVALAIVAVTLLPLGYLVIRALGAGEAGLTYLLDARTLAVVGNSLALVIAVALTAALVGVPFAWLTARSDLPFRRLWLVGGLLAMVIPSYIGAVTYIAAFGPRGLLQGALEPLGVERLPSIYGFFGAWLSITVFAFPYVVLPVRAALLNTDPALEEAARSMGLSRWRAFWRVTLPQLRPALAAGMLLTALYTLSDFGAVAMMRYDAFTRVIYMQYTSSFDRSRAAILALALVALTMGLLLVERRAARHTHNFRAGNGCQRELRPASLGRWKAPALVFCAVVVTLGTVIPVSVLLMWNAQPSSGRIAFDLHQAAVNTAGVSGVAAFIVGLAALPLGILAARSASRVNQCLVRLSYFGYVLPGIVVALALVFFAANALPAFYQTMPLLVLGYSVRFLPLSVGATSSALTQVSPRYEEAARSMGLRPWQAALRITVPLARAGILAGMALVFLNAMKELPTTLLLSPTGFKTLPAHIWTAYSQASLSQIGAPGLLLMVVSALSLFLVLGRERGRQKSTQRVLSGRQTPPESNANPR